MLYRGFIKILLSVNILILVMACSEEDQDKVMNSYLVGEWKGPCTYEDSYGWVVHSVSFNESSTYSGNLEIYSGEGCVEHERDVNHYVGTYVLGEKVVTPNKLEAIEIDLDSDLGGGLLTIVSVQDDEMYFGSGTGGFDVRHSILNMDDVYVRNNY